MATVTYEAVLLDIEGTITPVSFVYDTLFPYAHDHLRRYLSDNWDDEDVQKDVQGLRKQAREDGRAIEEAGEETMREAVVEYAHDLMHADRKVTALKSLQGKIWRHGYENGQLRGEFYDDVMRALARWNAHGIPVAIYSSGSVEAQQLLFQYAEEGDLSQFISDWFDTTTGAKRDSASYKKIARRLRFPAEKVLFFTDVVAEAEAAREAGMQAIIMDRLGNDAQPPHQFPVESDLELV